MHVRYLNLDLPRSNYAIPDQTMLYQIKLSSNYAITVFKLCYTRSNYRSNYMLYYSIPEFNGTVDPALEGSRETEIAEFCIIILAY